MKAFFKQKMRWILKTEKRRDTKIFTERVLGIESSKTEMLKDDNPS